MCPTRVPVSPESTVIMRNKLYAGSKLREIRQRLNVTQKDFAQKLGVSLPYANQMENNHLFITYDIVMLSISPVN
jgi:DNA-binding XRE family transcriptional regulator